MSVRVALVVLGLVCSACASSESDAVRDEVIDAEALGTSLISAAWNDDVADARALIARGADVNHQDSTQQSAYLIATSEGHLELLDLTFCHGADVASLDSYNGTGLIRAAERGHADVVGRLLQTDIDVNHINNLGWTALHESIILGDGTEPYLDTVRLLIAGGADVELESQRDGTPPLEHAESRGQDDVAATLMAALTPASSDTADAMLLDAVRTGDADAAAVALGRGADMTVRDSDGTTLSELASRNGHDAVARLLTNLSRPSGEGC